MTNAFIVVNLHALTPWSVLGLFQNGEEDEGQEKEGADQRAPVDKKKNAHSDLRRTAGSRPAQQKQQHVV